MSKLVFGEDETQRIIRSVKYTERMANSEAIGRRRSPADTDVADQTGGTGGGGCCCNELDCLHVKNLPITARIVPQYYEFTPSSLLCGCTPSGDEQKLVQLWPVSTLPVNVWESKHGVDDNPPMCLGSTTELSACTATATWTWTNAVFAGTCGGTITYTRIASDTGGFRFNIVDNCICSSTGLNGCGGPEGTGSEYDDCGGNFINCSQSLSIGQSLTVPCAAVACGTSGYWTMTSLDSGGCGCTPVRPDFEGTTNGQTATTTCDGTKIIDGSGILLPAFWRLTIVEGRDYYGCDATRLEFIIGGAV